jgi:hypothetical protein
MEMMNDPASLVALSVSGLAAVGLVSTAGLRAWADWLELRRLDLTGLGRGSARAGPPTRLELADLRTRVKRLEAIANGAES